MSFPALESAEMFGTGNRSTFVTNSNSGITAAFHLNAGVVENDEPG